MSGHWTVLAVVAIVSLLIDGGGAGAAGQTASTASQVLEVTATPSHVNVTAHETPLADVLRAIGQQAGVKIVLRGELNTPVTATLANVPLDEAIRRLSRFHSVVLIYDRTIDWTNDVMLAEVWVTGSRLGPDIASQGRMSGQPTVAAPARRTTTRFPMQATSRSQTGERD